MKLRKRMWNGLTFLFRRIEQMSFESFMIFQQPLLSEALFGCNRHSRVCIGHVVVVVAVFTVVGGGGCGGNRGGLLLLLLIFELWLSLSFFLLVLMTCACVCPSRCSLFCCSCCWEDLGWPWEDGSLIKTDRNHPKPKISQTQPHPPNLMRCPKPLAKQRCAILLGDEKTLPWMLFREPTKITTHAMKNPHSVGT